MPSNVPVVSHFTNKQEGTLSTVLFTRWNKVLTSFCSATTADTPGGGLRVALSPVCVHPVAEEIDEHEHEKREGFAAAVQPGEHQEQPRRRAAVRHHV